MATEYAAKLILTLDQVRQTERAQRNIYDSGIVTPNESYLAELLGATTSILGLVFLQSTAVGLASGVVGLVSGMLPNEKDVLQQMVYEGYWQLGYIEDFLVDNPQYDRLEVNLPFIEYPERGVRFITGAGVVTRVHSGSGWIIM